MEPNQQQQVTAETLRQILNQDAQMLQAKIMILEDRRDALIKLTGSALKDADPESPENLSVIAGIIEYPGVREYLSSYVRELQLELHTAKRQLEAVEYRLRELKSSIVVPPSSSGFRI